ncbi:Non-reducing polyketide synthase adrD [Frankliniella fusca]|uniref:Non-reducing polyketide synthase adrD n=1 Tax=Frankliniella fusca TaxID=407009 RepID=A0AAE1HYN5_9NEOP|nr:Non-reducing polyketide synthase adrD [Frankliniella fusca]
MSEKISVRAVEPVSESIQPRRAPLHLLRPFSAADMPSTAILFLSMTVLVVAALGGPEEPTADKALRLNPKLFHGSDDGRAGVGGECTMEVPVKVVGECVPLGAFSRGCVAGAYMEAFHQDC